MTEPVTISNEPLKPGMDYTRLRAEGQQHIARLAGRNWTDYNTSDPGITLLESLCYIITDLAYRIDFDLEDLLAPPPDSAASGKQFFSAREILTVNPLTVTDYRKLLIDIPGVRNAWLEKALETEAPVVYQPGTVSLKFPYETTRADKPHRLNGLYRVLLEPDAGADADDVIRKAQERLSRCRNLGEDFLEVRTLRAAEITIGAEIEVRRNADVNETLAQVYERLEGYLSPAPGFRSLEQQLAAGYGVEDIFSGPPLESGFLDDAELAGIRRRTELRGADIISLLMEIEGVTAVRNMRLSQGSHTPVDWDLKLRGAESSSPVLKPADEFISSGDITFFTHEGTGMVLPEPGIVMKKLESLRARRPGAELPGLQLSDIRHPDGKYRNLTDYVSVQDELPGNYGVGRHGLPDSADAQRRAQAKQLQAYLLVFDQLLLNYLAQLAHAKELLAVQPERGIAVANMPPPTYFTAPVPAGMSGAEEIIANYRSGFPGWLAGLAADPEVDTDRMNRFLDHLLARHGQDFTPSAALYAPADVNSRAQSAASQVKVIPAKQRFLRECAELSRDRARGANYREADDIVNIDGLAKRVCRLLDIENNTLSTLSGFEGFHLVDHILLRPDLPSGHVALRAAELPGKIRCSCRREHGLEDGDEVGFIRTSGGSYTDSVYPVEIIDEHDFLFTPDNATIGESAVQDSQDPNQAPDPVQDETGIWVPALQKRDQAISFLKGFKLASRGEKPVGNSQYSTVFQTLWEHGLSEGDTVMLINAGRSERISIYAVTADTFEVDVPFNPSIEAGLENVRWHREPLYPDPYSCRISFVFSTAGRAAAGTDGQRFRELAAEIIRAETPAHLTPYLHWFGDDTLQRFETDYRDWLNASKAAETGSGRISVANAALKLLEWLI